MSEKLYVYKKEDGHGSSFKRIAVFNTYNSFFSLFRLNRDYFKYFGNNPDIRVERDMYWPGHHYGPLKASVNDKFLEFNVNTYVYVVYDENENLVPVGTLKNLFGEWKKTKIPRWIFRFAGIKSSNCSYFRRIRTFQEKKWSKAWTDEEFAPKIRAKRGMRRLPDAWDDYQIAARENRNWKEFRKTQWREYDESPTRSKSKKR